MANKLTVQQVAAFRKKDKPYKINVDLGLQLRVASNGVKTWIVQYVINGKQREYRLPKPWGDVTDGGHLSLADARDEAATIRALARQGIDYQIQLQRGIQVELLRQEKEASDNLTVQALFNAWIETTERKDGGAQLRHSFDRNVLPLLGKKPLKTLIEADITEVLQPIVERGANRTAVMVLNNIKQMFKWGEGRRPWKLLIDNPATNLAPEKITSSEYDGKGRSRTLTASEIRELAIKVPLAGLLRRNELVIWILLACCTRIGETVKARWEHVDLINEVWFIPAENSKNGEAHTVFLSRFAIEGFWELKKLSGDSEWCFPDARDTTHACSKSITKQIRDRQLIAMNRKPMANRSKAADALVLAGGDWVPHDLRRTGATMMQSLGITPDVIERVLNHVEPNKMKRIYHQYDYAKEKREAWRLLGDRLTLIMAAPDNVLTLQRKA